MPEIWQTKNTEQSNTGPISSRQLNRRRFLKLAGAVGVVVAPMVIGYGLIRDIQGELPTPGSPYAHIDKLKSGMLSGKISAPILLLVNERSYNPFGLYLAEILRAEGLNCFQVADSSTLERIPLEQFDMVLLAEGTLNNSQSELLERYVAAGGGLVAMRPDAHLAALFGLEQVGGVITEGYLQVAAEHPVAQGITPEPVQIHGVADHYRLAGAQVVAWLSTHTNARTNFPAVTMHHYGQGQTAMWAFDLARSVAYTRQGNPAWANHERDGLEYIRACDMFKDWIDLERLSIPQADEQQRLLANQLAALSQTRRPLPRLWYFPGATETMLIATGDSHGNPATAIEDVLSRVEQYGGRMSIYYTPPLAGGWRESARRAKRWTKDLLKGRITQFSSSSLPTSWQVAGWRARGHEFGLHPYVEEGLEAGWDLYWRNFTSRGYGPVSPTTRTHRILWTGWVETARLQAAYGVQMNLDYYLVGPIFQKEAGIWVYGHFTGSGLPMKFVDEQGRILNIYQQTTQLADEHLMKLHWESGWPKLSAEVAVEVSQILLEHSLKGGYSAVTGQFHVDSFTRPADDIFYKKAAYWLEGTLDYAASQNIPIWPAAEWLRFTEIRHDTIFEAVQWHPETGRLSFQVVAPVASNVQLSVMVPLWHGEAKLVQVEVDGRQVAHRPRQVGGVSYGWVSVEADSRQVVASYV